MSKHPNHVEFSNRSETVVAFSHDRGVLKSNSFGDYFFRGTTDNRFCCCSEDLERKLIDMGIRAGERVGIRKVLRNRIATWEVRRMDAADERAAPREVTPDGRPGRKPIPDSKYSDPAPVPPVTTPAPEHSRNQEETASREPITSVSLIARSLCEAIDAAAAGHAHAAAIGFPLTFSSSDIQDLASTIFIQRCRDGAITDRMPPARQTSGRVNGAATAQTH